MLFGYLNMTLNYSLFTGDYVSPEPRLRSMMMSPNHAYGSIYKAMVGTIGLSDLPPPSRTKVMEQSPLISVESPPGLTRGY